MEFPPLFSGQPQHEAFPRYRERYQHVAMEPPEIARPFPQGAPTDLPASFVCGAEEIDTAEFLDRTDTAALLVIHDGEIRHERYALTGGREVQWISWSVAKSFVSALIGIAIEEGAIAGVDVAITDYIDVPAGSAYDGVHIRDVLQMSSGARWNEDYSDPTSDVHRFGRTMNGDQTLDEFLAEMVPEHPPGTLCRYNSADTQALGALLVAATGRQVADYMQDKLVTPLGMEQPGYWLTDSVGMEMAFGGLLLTARDFAKLGELYRLGGSWHGEQLVPEAWVEASTSADAAHLQPGATTIAGHTLEEGYGYQWWLYDRDDYTAIGIYNQYIHVDPGNRTVIVKLSAYRRYGTIEAEADDRVGESRDFFRAVAGNSADG